MSSSVLSFSVCVCIMAEAFPTGFLSTSSFQSVITAVFLFYRELNCCEILSEDKLLVSRSPSFMAYSS